MSQVNNERLIFHKQGPKCSLLTGDDDDEVVVQKIGSWVGQRAVDSSGNYIIDLHVPEGGAVS